MEKIYQDNLASSAQTIEKINKEKETETMENNGITPVMPVGGDGSFMWIFGLLILLGLFNGGGFGFGGNGNTNS